MLRFDGRVVVVTGAGGGLGREYALLFADRGASIVVNDLGGTAHGDGKNSSMADAVVEEIRRRGGKAVANYDSVENGDKIIKTAIDNFGRVDIVVNNAGILRDKSFQNMTELDWDLIMRVHLKGAYSVTKAAWPYMKQQKFGRVIMTSSNSGVFGNFGQANYSAAKSGLIGMSNALALEGAKYNVYCNAIIPTAGSRLTQSVLPDDVLNELKPEFIAPLVCYLCHESCQENGGLFEAAAGWFGKVHWVRSNGAVLRRKNYYVKPEDVRDNWTQVTDMNGAKHFTSMTEVLGQLMGVVQQVGQSNNESRGEPKKGATVTVNGKGINVDLAKARQFQPGTFDVTFDHTILYALGVGASVAKELHLLNENHENFCVLPTFAVVPSFAASDGLLATPGLENVDFTKVLHGEEYMEFYQPFPSSGKIIVHPKVVDIIDKGSGAVVLFARTLVDEKGQKLAYIQSNIFLRGEGGFGGARHSAEDKPPLDTPKRQPDATYAQKTSPEQAALYRVASTDHNPLHIDPSFAQVAGFKEPILHGLCSFGFSIRHVLLQYANGDVNKLRAVKARFSRPVYPGQTLITEMWKEGDRVHFQTKVKETGEVAISGGYAQFHALPASGGGGSSDGSGPRSKQSELESALVFDELQKRLKALPGIAKKTQAIFLWVITKDGKEAGKWTVDLKNGDGEIYEGDPKTGKAGVTLTIDDSNMMPLVTGKMNAQQAFMNGKLKIKGNIMLTQKLQSLLKEHSKL